LVIKLSAFAESGIATEGIVAGGHVAVTEALAISGSGAGHSGALGFIAHPGCTSASFVTINAYSVSHAIGGIASRSRVVVISNGRIVVSNGRIVVIGNRSSSANQGFAIAIARFAIGVVIAGIAVSREGGIVVVIIVVVIAASIDAASQHGHYEQQTKDLLHFLSLQG
jgi:hypothetical protein